MEEFEKFLNSTLKFLSYRPRSEKEVRENLLKKKAPHDLIEKIIEFLKKQKYVSDEEFATWWIEQRLRFRPKGMRIIRLELKQKGVAQDVIDKVIEQLTKSEETVVATESTILNDLVSAKKLVKKRLPKYKNLSGRELYQRLGAFLARRGFDWETIKKAIDEEMREK